MGISVIGRVDERLEERFWSKVDKTEDCWLWTASTCGRGYGQFYVYTANGRPYMALAHRAAYELVRGAIPDDHELDHRCKNIRCVNPDHLEPVTHTVNVQRGSGNRNVHKTHCPQGHPYDIVHRWRDARAGKTVVARRCSICRREQERRRWGQGS